jgi:hypothetical protein
MRDRFDVEYHTNSLTWVILLSCLLNKDLYYKWLIEVEVLPTNDYKVSIKNNVIGLLRRKKDILKERNNIINLVRVAEKYINTTKDNNDHARPDIPVFYPVGNPPLETWIGDGAIRAFLLKKPDTYIPVFILAIPASANSHINIINKKSIELSNIERKIQPLVIAINNISSVWTTFSCCGHIFREPRSPYVSFFTTNIEYILKLNQIITNSRTNYRWLLKGIVFNNKIQWTITTETKRTFFNNKKIDEDIIILASNLNNSKGIPCKEA